MNPIMFVSELLLLSTKTDTWFPFLSAVLFQKCIISDRVGWCSSVQGHSAIWDIPSKLILNSNLAKLCFCIILISVVQSFKTIGHLKRMLLTHDVLNLNCLTHGSNWHVIQESVWFSNRISMKFILGSTFHGVVNCSSNGAKHAISDYSNQFWPRRPMTQAMKGYTIWIFQLFQLEQRGNWS